MKGNLTKINTELEIIEAKVNDDFFVLDSFQKEISHFMRKLYQDWRHKKITTKQYLNYRKQAKKILKQDFSKLENDLNDDLFIFKEKYVQSIKEHNKLVKEKKQKHLQMTPKGFIIVALIVIPVCMVIGLTLNYLLVAPLDFSNHESVIGFSISMFIIVADLVFLYFNCKGSAKKMMIDRYNSAAKVVPIAFVASFCDVLGIGSFATSTNLLKVTKSIKDDKKIPGTLNTGLAISNLFTGCLFIGAVEVEMTTLIPFVVCAVIGSLIGSKIVTKVNTRVVQLVMGVVLAFTAIIMLLTVKGIEVLPSGSLKGVFAIWWKFVLGCFGFIVLGIFMSFGIGLYAPAMAIISLLGINFLVVFPIMTISAGLSMHINAYRYYHATNYLPKTSFCMSLGGIVGVLTSFILVFVVLQTQLGISPEGIEVIFQWLSVPIIAYVSFLLLWSYTKETKKFKNQAQENNISPKVITIDYNNFGDFIKNWSNTLVQGLLIK